MLWREGWRVLSLGSTILLRKKRLNKKPILLTEGLLKKYEKIGVGSFGEILWSGRYVFNDGLLYEDKNWQYVFGHSATWRQRGKHASAILTHHMLRSQGDRRFYTEVKEGADIHRLLYVGERGKGDGGIQELIMIWLGTWNTSLAFARSRSNLSSMSTGDRSSKIRYHEKGALCFLCLVDISISQLIQLRLEFFRDGGFAV